METKKQRAFDLPKMKIEYAKDIEQIKTQIEEGKVFFSVFQDAKGDLKCAISENNEEVLAALIVILHRNIFVHELVRLAYITIERFRNGDLKEATEFMQQGITYIKQLKSAL